MKLGGDWGGIVCSMLNLVLISGVFGFVIFLNEVIFVLLLIFINWCLKLRFVWYFLMYFISVGMYFFILKSMVFVL